MLIAWLALTSGAALGAAGWAPVSSGLGFYAATLVTGWPGAAQRRRSGLTPGSRGGPRRVMAFGLGVIGGVATHPGLVLVIGVLGYALREGGILPAPGPLGEPLPGSRSVALLVPLLVLSPLFEETLYRGMLLPRCRRRFGPHAAVLISGLAFALPHVRPWPIFGALVAGIVLGAIRLRSRDAVLCIAIHMGWNAAACLAAPARWSELVLVAASGLLGTLAIAGALRLDRARGDARRPA